jgi:hypothetical protein
MQSSSSEFQFLLSFSRAAHWGKNCSQSEVATWQPPVSNYSIKSIVLIDFINITEIASAVPFRQAAEASATPRAFRNLQTGLPIHSKGECASNCSSKNQRFSGSRANGGPFPALKTVPRPQSKGENSGGEGCARATANSSGKRYRTRCRFRVELRRCPP